jgi:PAS domain S-box-containing protein
MENRIAISGYNGSLNELSNFYDSILDIFSDGIYISDFHGTTIKINKTYEQLTGLKREELIGRNVVDIRNEGKYDIALNPEIVRTGLPKTAVQVTQLGKRVLLSGNPVFDENGKVVFVVTFVRDITSLTQMQEQIAYQQNLISRYNEVGFEKEEATRFLATKNREIQDLLERIEAFARADATVLLLGETGVGKDVFARKIHENSPRSRQSFFKVDCTSLPANLVETELFGYEAGAFSGANVKGKPGFVEMADKGTLFLDEIGDLPAFMQAKLLRVLQDQEIIRVGSTKVKKIDVRFIAATNRDLEKEVKGGKFRSDLFYRLQVGVFNIPPLRKRQEDIEPLAIHFLRVFNTKYRKQIILSSDVINLLQNYDWPGNIRELENLMQTLVISSKKNVIEIFDLPNTLTADISAKSNKSLPDILSEMEKDLLKKALATHRTIAEVANYFQMDRTTIFRKIRRYGLQQINRE